MAAKKQRKKAAVPAAGKEPKPASVGVLDRLNSDELAAVLRSLLTKHPALQGEAEAIAAEGVSSPSVEGVADDVFFNVTNLDLDDLNGRAGRHSWGYVEPVEAAEELFEESVAGNLEDMLRRMDLGFETASEAVCMGIVLGLFRAGKNGSSLLEWDPDFPAEHAGYVVDEYLRKCPAEKRNAAAERLAEKLGRLVPEWAEMISKEAKRATQGT